SYLQTFNRISSQYPGLHSRDKTFFNRRKIFLRNNSAFGLINQHKTLLPVFTRPHLKADVCILTTAAGLLNEAFTVLYLFVEFLFKRNFRRTLIQFNLMIQPQFFNLHLKV